MKTQKASEGHRLKISDNLYAVEVSMPDDCTAVYSEVTEEEAQTAIEKLQKEQEDEYNSTAN
jgi:hypothetical protein